MSGGLSRSRKDGSRHRLGGWEGPPPHTWDTESGNQGLLVFLGFLKSKQKRGIGFYTVTPSGEAGKLAINPNGPHTYGTIFIKLLNKAKDSEAFGSQLFSPPRQRQKPATSSLLLLFSCQVGDSVKIESASHLFI